MSNQRVRRITVFFVFLALWSGGQVWSGGSKPGEPVSAEPKPKIYYWYYIDNGNLVATEDIRSISKQASYLPWTVAPRIAGFTELGESLYIGFNAHGVIATPKKDPLTGGYTIKENVPLFGGRVLSHMFVREGALYIHLYRNTVFSTPEPVGPTVALARIEPQSDDQWATPVDFVFQESNRDWEAVELLPSSDGPWKASWKKSGDKPEFKYLSFSYPGGPEIEVKREQIDKAYHLQDIRKAPIQLWNLYTEMADKAAKDVVYLITLTIPGAVAPERYRAGTPNALSGGRGRLRTIEAYRSGDAVALLDPPNRLRIAVGEESPETVLLPSLPEGTVYTGLWYGNGQAIAAWEDRDFPDVGLSGVLVVNAEM